MKRNRLLQGLLAAVAVWVGATAPACADTSVVADGEGGWQKLTALPSNVGDYYFIFADNSQDLMLEMRLGGRNPNNALYYMTSLDPLLNRTFLWTLEANSGTYDGMYSMRNVEFPDLMMQTEWDAGYKWDTNDQKNPCEWTAVDMQYDETNKYWTLENGKYPSSSDAKYKGFLGPWDEGNTNTALASGQELAANKSGDYVGHFQIYAILKSAAAEYYASRIAGATAGIPLDVSYYISNREAELSGLSCWTTSGLVARNTGSETYDGQAGFFEPSDWNASSFSCSMTQTLTDLPAGRYQVQAAAQASTGCTLTLTATSGTSTATGTLASKGASGSSFAAKGGWEWLNTGTVTVQDGSLTIKVNTSASTEHNWGNIDGFRLLYLGEVSTTNLSAGDDCTTLFITNPGFEDNEAVVNLSADNLTGVKGWTLASAANTSDIGTREYSNNTYATLNCVGSYCFNSYWEGKPLTQTLDLPAGVYELSALVTTGNGSSTGTVYLNAGDAHSTGYARKSSNTNFFHRERLIFTLTEAQPVSIGIRGGSDVEGTAAKGA